MCNMLVGVIHIFIHEGTKDREISTLHTCVDANFLQVYICLLFPSLEIYAEVRVESSDQRQKSDLKTYHK